MKSRLFFLQSLMFISLVVFYSCNGNNGQHDNNVPTIPSDSPSPSILSYSIITSYPHDTSSFTQGLAFYNGELYEGTGDPDYTGKSKLMKVDLLTGKKLNQTGLTKEYFGEGITILKDTIYQLTWKNKVVFVYTLKDFKKVKEFKIDTEGWGITHDGKNLIVSTGSGDLYFYDPATFRLLTKSTVMEGGNQTFNLNELEYIDGFVYANQWQYPYILKIDPIAGKVVAKYDMTEMYKRIQAIDPAADVPNGIAYNSATKKIYVTGKLWPELFEIQLSQ